MSNPPEQAFLSLDVMRRFFRILSVGLLLLFPVVSWGALDIQFDYTYDTSNYFSGANVGRRALLDAAASVFETRLTLENFGTIAPSGGNTWSLSFPSPSTGSTVTLNNLTIPANTIRIYVGARDLPGSFIGFSNYQYTYFGDASWVSLFQARDSATNFDSFGGAITFDSPTSFYFDSDPLTLDDFPGQYDFYSVAQHEIEHLLGFTNGANAFRADTSGTTFVGSNVVSLRGGPAPLASSNDLDHWQQGLQSGGDLVLMAPALYFNQRNTATALDFAALKDIGYNINSVPEPTVFNLMILAAATSTDFWRHRNLD